MPLQNISLESKNWRTLTKLSLEFISDNSNEIHEPLKMTHTNKKLNIYVDKQNWHV